MIRITDIQDPRIDIFTKLNENQLAHFYEPELGLFLAESMKVLERAILAGYEPVIALVEQRLEKEVEKLLEKYPETLSYVAEFEVLTKLAGYHMTGGVLCAMRRRQLAPVEEIVGNSDFSRIAVLENVVNPTNIGAIFRNAAALNIDAVVLSKGCCDPLYKRAIRVSMGTVFQIPWTFANDDWPDKAFEDLRNNAYKTVAMALREDSFDIKNGRIKSADKLAILLGSEGNGLTDETLALCDYTVMIPMSHEVDSLNVAAASALAFWELGNN